MPTCAEIKKKRLKFHIHISPLKMRSPAGDAVYDGMDVPTIRTNLLAQ
jgi:hypothetical protein